MHFEFMFNGPLDSGPDKRRELVAAETKAFAREVFQALHPNAERVQVLELRLFCLVEVGPAGVERVIGPLPKGECVERLAQAVHDETDTWPPSGSEEWSFDLATGEGYYVRELQ